MGIGVFGNFYYFNGKTCNILFFSVFSDSLRSLEKTHAENVIFLIQEDLC